MRFWHCRAWCFASPVLLAAFTLMAAFAYAEVPAGGDLPTLIRKELPLERADSLAVMVYDTTSGEEVFAFNSERPLKPASVLKVLTSLVSLELLGPNYRFATRLFGGRVDRGSLDSLYIQGTGDPSLTVETAWALARSVRRRGIGAVSEVTVDPTLFVDDRNPSGRRAFQTGSSALSFNYNSFSFEICPTSPGQHASVVPDPIELNIPLIGYILTKTGNGKELAVDQAVKSASGAGVLPYQVRGAIGIGSDCQTVYRSMPEPAAVFGGTFVRMLAALGIKTPEHFKQASTPERAELLYTQESPPLSQILRDLNNFSNNFIAEQILFAIGQTEQGTYSRQRGLDRMAAYLRSMGFKEPEFHVEDASGLSHDDRLSARIILGLLKRAMSNQQIAPEFESSLAVGERSGTLKKRPVDPRGVVLRGKTGTLDGVSSLAGYVVGQSGKKYAFVILQNAVASTERAHALENKLVAILSGG